MADFTAPVSNRSIFEHEARLMRIITPKILFISFVLFLLLPFHLKAQRTDPDFYASLKSNKILRPYLKRAQKYRIQVICTPVDKDNTPGQTFFFNYSPQLYFYPASTVKFPVALMALEKSERLGLDKSMTYSSENDMGGYAGVSPADSQSIESYVKKIFLVSDNDAFNRLYDFVGPDEINKKLMVYGAKNSRINHRLSIFLSQEQNRQTPVVNIGPSFFMPPKTSERAYTAAQPIWLGKQYVKGDSLIKSPMDFSAKNQFDLLDQHRLLQKLYFPESLPEIADFQLSDENLAFVKDYMSRLPKNGGYDSTAYPDNYVKFLIFGDRTGAIPDHIKIYNKVGDAYGFMIDIAFIYDEKSGKKMLLSAVIYANKNQTLNDNTYEYESKALPFLAELGRHLLNNFPAKIN